MVTRTPVKRRYRPGPVPELVSFSAATVAKFFVQFNALAQQLFKFCVDKSYVYRRLFELVSLYSQYSVGPYEFRFWYSKTEVFQ